MSIAYILGFTAVSVTLAMIFMSFMTSEAESAGEWFQQSFLGKGLPQDERELKKRRDAKMERLLNEKIRVGTPKEKDAKGEKGTGTGTGRKGRKDADKDTGTGTDTDGPELRKRTTRAEAKKEK